MRIARLEASGPALDRRVATRILGRRHAANSPAYSTEEAAAETLMTRLELEGLTATFEQDEGVWYCVFWLPRPNDGVKERLSSGAAESRPLAICRAVLNLPLIGSGRALRIRAGSEGWIDADAPVGDDAAPGLHAVPHDDEESPADSDGPWLVPDVADRATG